MKYLLCLLISINIFALTPNDLMGCFETIKINDSSISYGPDYERNLSTFEDFGTSYTYRNIQSNRAEQINIFTFFQGVRDEVYFSYSPMVFFKNLGKYESGEASLSYEIDEDIYMRDSRTYAYKKVDHRMSFFIEKRGDFYEGSVELISHIRNIDRGFSFILKQVTCPTSY